MTTTATTEMVSAAAGEARAGGGPFDTALRSLFAPVDVASLVYFRVAVAAVVLWEVARYFAYGWIARYYITPPFHFTYYGFSWVQPWPGAGMYVHFAVLGLCAAGVLAGYCYGVAAAGLWATFTYVFLLDQARYLNHFYLLSLLTFLLIWLPAHRAWSVDARRHPAIASDSAPRWTLWLVRFQVGVPYVFAAFAKLNPDWLAGEPIGSWLRAHSHLPVVGPVLAQPHLGLLFAYGGLLFDLAIVPLMLWRRTRPFGFGAAVLFHAMNATVFNIGVFPVMMIAATAMFFDPSWPRHVARRFGMVFPIASRSVAQCATLSSHSVPWRRCAVAAALGCYVLLQVTMPLRHWLYPGDVNWTEYGHRFSWRMKLRDKDALVHFVVRNRASGEYRAVDPLRYVTPWQAEAMAARPDMILQLAQHIAAVEPRPVAVTAVAWSSLNGHPFRELIDPEVDLAAAPRTLWPANWIRLSDVADAVVH